MSICSNEQLNNIKDVLEWFDIDPENINNVDYANELIRENIEGWEDFDLNTFIHNKNVTDLFIEYNVVTEQKISEMANNAPKNLTNSNVIPGISNFEVSEMFVGIPLAKSFFEKYLNTIIANEVLIGNKDSDIYVDDDESISKNLHRLKNEIYRDIQEFLKARNLLGGEITDLFDDNGGIIDHNAYTSVMNNAYKFFFKGGMETYSFNNKIVPNLNISIEGNAELFDIYNKLILLNNFDSVIASNLNHILAVDFSDFNSLHSMTLDTPKYSLKIDPRSTLYWNQESHEANSSENKEIDIARIIVESIPLYNNHGVRKEGEYLEMKDLYLFGSLISNFESLYGNEFKNDKSLEFKYLSEDANSVLEFYIDMMINPDHALKAWVNKPLVTKGNAKTGMSLSNIKSTVHSLNNFINNPDLNIRKKEETSKQSVLSLITQTLKNNYGSMFSTYGDEYEILNMSQQNWNNISVNNLLIGKIAGTGANGNMFWNDDIDMSLKSIFEKHDLYSSEELLFDTMKNLITDEIPEGFARDYADFINNIIGIPLHKNSLTKIIKDFIDSNISWEENEVFNYSRLYQETKKLLEGIKSDAESDDFKTYVKGRLFKGTSGLLKEVGVSPWYLSIRNAYLDDYIVKPMMNINSAQGSKMPSFKSSNLTFKDSEIINLQRIFEDNFEEEFKYVDGVNVYKSLLTRNSPAVLGTSAKMEISKWDSANKKMITKDAVDFTPSENFISDFQYDFLESLNVNNTFQIILGNYSDKKSIYTKIINGDFEFEYNNKNVKLLSLNNDDLLQVYRTQTKNYHQNALLSIFRDYKKVFKVAGINANINVEGNFDDNLNSNINAINEVLRSKSIYEINSEYAKNYDYSESITGLTEELHYSSYNEGGTKIVQLNQMLTDIYNVFNNNSMFDAYIKKEEELFLTKYNKHLGSDHKLFSWISDNTIKKLGLNGAVTSNDKSIMLKNGNINPLVKKWLWTNALIRGEYIYATAKGEYMHPHKKNSEIREFITPQNYTGDNYNEYFDKWMNDFTIERSGRLESMAKRNVIYTASIQPPTTHGKFVEPKKINIAAIQDYKDSAFTTSGYSSSVDAHDGSSYIDDTYSRAVDASQPGAGYSGTKKRFGTLITPFGVTIKKDAETQLTNDRIRESLKSDIRLLNKKRQMLSIPISNNDIDTVWNKDYSYRDIYYIHNGLKNKINSIVLSKSEDKTGLNMTVNVFNDVKGHVSNNYKVDTLFEIWDNVGGIYNVDNDGNFTEASNDIMEDLITDNNRLFDKMIHILSNTSALKAGATAVNPMSAWTDNSRLLYTTYDNIFMGNQLDANHQADQSEIKEVTQMMAAIAQNGYTSDWAREVYKDLERIIEEAAKPYKRSLESSEDGLYKYMSEKFIDAINRTGSDGLAESIINLMNEDGVKIPFSNVTFFNQFVKNVITNLNSEFISRHYSGIGSVLIPSHGIIQLYDVILPTGEIIVATQSDILKRALAEVENNKELVGKTNDEILQHFLDNSPFFKPVELIRNEDNTFPFEVGDWISINDGKAIEIKSPEIYYKTQYNLKNTETVNVKRVFNKTRDLKPTLHNFTVGQNKKNVYDFKSLEMLYELKAYEDNRPAINHDNENTLIKILDKYGKKDSEKIIRSYLQLEFSLLDKGYIVDNVFNLDMNFTTMPVNDVINRLSDKNVLKSVDSVEFKAAEKVISDIYKTNFNRNTNDSLFDINVDPIQYFKNILNNYFAEDDNKYDLKIITSRFDNPIYIKYVDSFSNRSNFGLNLKTERDIEGNSSKTRYNRDGKKIYSIKDRVNKNDTLLLADDYYNIIIDSNGNEVIEIKSIEQSLINNKGEIETETSINRELENNINKLINSFGTSVKAVVPVKKGVDTHNLNLNNVTTKIFKNHYKNLVDTNMDSFIDRLASKIASSWKLSHEFIDARIPGQSMQSFMPMKNVAYMSGNTNDTYVSINQIVMQGSDFDIDKAYTLGYSINDQGFVETWTNVTDYSTLSELKEIMNLPMPTGLNSKEDINLEESSKYDITSELKSFVNSYNNLKDFSNFDVETIKAFNKLLTKINNNDGFYVYFLDTEGWEQQQDDFNTAIDLIDKHNTYKGYLNNDMSVKNSIVSKINRIISSPVNQILANTPVSVKELHDAIKRNTERKQNIINNYIINSHSDNVVYKPVSNDVDSAFVDNDYVHTLWVDKKEGDVFAQNFSNPFTTNPSEAENNNNKDRTLILVPDVYGYNEDGFPIKGDIGNYIEWILNNPYNIEHNRRQWILQQLINGDLKGKKFIDSTNNPTVKSVANALNYLANHYDWSNYSVDNELYTRNAPITEHNGVRVVTNDDLDTVVNYDSDSETLNINRTLLLKEWQRHRRPINIVDESLLLNSQFSGRLGVNVAAQYSTNGGVIKINNSEGDLTNRLPITRSGKNIYVNAISELFSNHFFNADYFNSLDDVSKLDYLKKTSIDYANWLTYDNYNAIEHNGWLSTEVKKKVGMYKNIEPSRDIVLKKQLIRALIMSGNLKGAYVHIPSGWGGKLSQNPKYLNHAYVLDFLINHHDSPFSKYTNENNDFDNQLSVSNEDANDLKRYNILSDEGLPLISGVFTGGGNNEIYINEYSRESYDPIRKYKSIGELERALLQKALLDNEESLPNWVLNEMRNSDKAQASTMPLNSVNSQSIDNINNKLSKNKDYLILINKNDKYYVPADRADKANKYTDEQINWIKEQLGITYGDHLRVSNFLQDFSKSANEYFDQATNIGTNVDDLLREYTKLYDDGNTESFKNLKSLNPTIAKLPDDDFNNFLYDYHAFLDNLYERGEKVVSTDEIRLFGEAVNGDTKTKIAGTVDLMTYNRDSKTYHIYDFKTFRTNAFDNNAGKYKFLYPGEKISKQDSHKLQLASYAIMLSNNYGIPLENIKIGVIPIKVYYEPTSRVNTLLKNGEPNNYYADDSSGDRHYFITEDTRRDQQNVTDNLIQFIMPEGNHVYDFGQAPSSIQSMSGYGTLKNKTSVDNTKVVKPEGSHTLHSGYAEGADRTFLFVGNQYNAFKTVNNYTYRNGGFYNGKYKLDPHNDYYLNELMINRMDNAILKANESLGRNIDNLIKLINNEDLSHLSPEEVNKYNWMLNTIRRNYYQALNSNAMYAIGNFNMDGKVDGGTGWAVQMAIDMINSGEKSSNYEINVFDQNQNTWFRYNTNINDFEMLEETPVLKNNFAGIGTRRLTLSGLKAINNLFTTTFGEINYKADAKKASIDSLNRVLVKSGEIVSETSLFGQESNYYEGDIKPEPNTVFVFGSNPEGRHGLGAAKIAKEQFGAVYGQGEGLQGNAYALPTKRIKNITPIKTGQMTFSYGKNKRENIQSSSTFEAIINGERTATTRYTTDGNIDYWKGLKVGDIVAFKSAGNKGVVYVRITKPFTKLNTSTNAEEWSKKEGWSVDYYNDKVKPKVEAGQAYQIEYEFIDANGERTITPKQITENIRKMYDVARQNPNKDFKVAYRNTTTASYNGYTGLEMIEMFNAAGAIPSNVIFSKEWVDTGKLNTQSGITPQQKQQTQEKGVIDKSTLIGSNDMFSYYEQQHNASIGRDNVGISANGVKVTYALADYSNDFYNTLLRNKENGLPINEELVKTKLFNFVFDWTSDDGKTIHHRVNSVADVQIPMDVRNELFGILGGTLDYKHSNAAKYLSDFLSAATDNAKELIMAKINASPTLASMPIFLYIIGFDVETMVEIMTSDIMVSLIQSLESNLFSENKQDSIYKIFENIKIKYSTDAVNSGNVDSIIKIYHASKEISSLASLLGVNQSRKANTFELYKYFNRFSSYLSTTSRSYSGYSSKLNVLTFAQSILAENPSNWKNLNDVMEIIQVAEDNDIIDNFDFEKYFDDADYNKITNDYINIIKRTVNPFDVIESVPHYKGMVDGLYTTHKILKRLSAKYKFIFDDFRKVTENKLPSEFDINRAQLYFDNNVISNWAKTSEKARSVQFSVKDLMRLSGVKEFTYYISPKAQNSSIVTGIDGTLNTKVAKIIKSSDIGDKIISLRDDVEIANFKLAVENLILPILQKHLGENNFFRLNTMNDKFNMKMTALGSEVPLRNSNIPVLIEKFSKVLNLFDTIDLRFKYNTSIKNTEGEYLKWKDLLFTYNLLVNNEKYGDNRLTALFQNYIGDADSFGYDYIKYYREIDSGRIDVTSSDTFADDLNFFVGNKNGEFNGIKANNSDFVILTNLVRDSSSGFSSFAEVNKIMDLINNNSLIVKLEC